MHESRRGRRDRIIITRKRKDYIADAAKERRKIIRDNKITRGKKMGDKE